MKQVEDLLPNCVVAKCGCTAVVLTGVESEE